MKFAAGKTRAACNQMAAFISQVKAFTPEFISQDEADRIIELAEQMMIDEGCS